MAIEGSTLDLVIHGMTVVAATALFVVSLRSYRQKRSPRFLYVMAAFAVFAVKEVAVLANVFVFHLPLVEAFIHALNLVILGLFFYGVVR